MKLRALYPLFAAAVAAFFVPAAASAAEAVLGKKVSTEAKKILGRSDKVIIAGFRVAFNTEGAASASTDSRLKNLGNTAGSGPKTVHGDARASLKVGLAGVTAEDFQRITEEAYADFKQRLAAGGYTVLGTDVLKASKGYGELKFTPSTKERPYVKDLSLGAGTTVVVYTPEELPLFLGHFDGVGIGGVSMNLGNWRALNQLSVETKAVVIVPTLAIDFVKMKSSGKGKMLRDTAEVGAEPQVALMGHVSGMGVFHAKIRLAGDLGNVNVEDDLEVPGAFGSIAEVSASDNKALVGTLAMLTGTVGTTSSRSNRVLTADPVEYGKLSLEAAKAYNAAMAKLITGK